MSIYKKAKTRRSAVEIQAITEINEMFSEFLESSIPLSKFEENNIRGIAIQAMQMEETIELSRRILNKIRILEAVEERNGSRKRKMSEETSSGYSSSSSSRSEDNPRVILKVSRNHKSQNLDKRIMEESSEYMMEMRKMQEKHSEKLRLREEKKWRNPVPEQVSVSVQEDEPLGEDPVIEMMKIMKKFEEKQQKKKNDKMEMKNQGENQMIKKMEEESQMKKQQEGKRKEPEKKRKGAESAEKNILEIQNYREERMRQAQMAKQGL